MTSTSKRDPDHSMPEHAPDPDNVESFLSKGMFALSSQDRNETTEEIHGVHCLAPDETPELLETSLSKMNIAIERMPQAQKIAFCRGQEIFPRTTYANDRDFRLRFLRSELFDAEKAAIRLVKYMDFILEIFGQDHFELLERPIQLKDLEADEETYNVLQSGFMQLLNYRDRSGRRIAVSFMTNKLLSFSVYARLRVFTYIWLMASNDVESQRKGFVGVILPARSSGSDMPFRPSMPRKEGNGLQMKFYASIPMRIISLHLCFSDTFFYRVGWSVVALAVGERNKRRLKFRMGGLVEMKYGLMGYGIPLDVLPSSDTGNMKLKDHFQWIQARKLIEDEGRAQDNIVECPGLNDVVFQKAGKSWKLHPGDVFYRGLIESNHKKHSVSSQTAKKQLIWSIVEEIESKKGRFLAYDKRGWWIQLKERAEIRKKVAISFRNFNSQCKVAQKRHTSACIAKKRKGCGACDGSYSGSSDDSAQHSACV